MKLPLWLPLALAGALALSVYSCQRAEREKGAIGVKLAASEARGDSLRARRAIVDTLWKRDVRTVRVAITEYDTARVTDTLTRNDTVFVARDAADAAVNACRAVILICEARVAIADSLTANAENRVMILKRLVNQPRTAIGLAWDARGGLGVAGDRDWHRFRVGASITPNGMGLRVSVWW